ncbi:MAG: 50S ribosomal protein L11 methyltransferase [Bacteroidales bacterium]|jgi:ribosomal protein L11 methyltransferase|nr:50S ribosomal protein L11 methyltransferase [Bacteroidales bacterium]
MKYIEIDCVVSPAETGNEIVIALLADMGCESFVESENGVLAYIGKDYFDEKRLETLFAETAAFDFSVSYSWKEMEEQNWNAVWESNYEAVLIDNSCYIRAPFHRQRKDVEYEIVIEPKMSFGTAHHPTTSQMIRYLLEEDCKDKTVLDMGSGTGVLAIFAMMRGAKTATAIDNDTWAYENCLENAEKNHISDIEVVLGDANDISGTFDLILANINRNILMQDMEKYANALNKNGVLLLSGFYLDPDLNILKGEAEKHNLVFDSFKEQENWTAARFLKK